MRSLTFIGLVAFLGIATTHAYTDFSSLGDHPIRSETGDNHVRLSHSAHHKFEETGTHYQLHYEAEHHKELRFVELHEHVGHFSSQVKCGDEESADKLLITNPSATLLAAISIRSAQGIIVTAHPRYHCNGKHILRRVQSSWVDTATKTLHLETKAVRLNSVFRNLKLRMETSHIHSAAEQHSTTSAQAQVQDDSSIVQKPGQSARSFSTQWSLFSAVDRCVHKVSHVVSEVKSDASKAVSAVSTVAGVLTTGDYTHDFSYNITGVNYNGNAAQTYQKSQIVMEHGTAAASLQFAPTVYLDLDIADFKAQSIESYVTGALHLAANAHVNANLQYSDAKNDTVTTVKLSPITFAIGPIPVVIKTTVPVRAGFSVEVDGALNATGVITAAGTAKVGLTYSENEGFQAIRSQSFSYTKDIQPLQYSVDAGLSLFVQPTINVVIDDVLDFNVVLAVDSHMELQSNSKCLAYVAITAQPTVSLSAGLDITLFSHTILSKSYGPNVLYTHLFPLYSYCRPQIAGLVTTGNNRAMLTQGTSTNRHSHLRNSSLNTDSVVVTATGTTKGFVGMTWSSQDVRCPTNGYIKEDVSAMFADGYEADTTVLVVTITKSFELVPSSRGFQSHLIQGVYSMRGSLTHTTASTMTLVTNRGGTFVSTSNATTHPVSIANTIYVAGSNQGSMTSITLSSSNLCAGSVVMTSPEMNNDNSTFFTLASGYPRVGPVTSGNAAGNADVMTSRAKTLLYALIAASTVAVVSILALVVVTVRKSSALGERLPQDDDSKEAQVAMVGTSA